MKRVSISLVVALAVAALLCGNCLSCPEMATAHSCCHKPQPASVKCHMENMRQFVKADGPAPQPRMTAELAEAPAADALRPQRLDAALPDLDAPPGSPGIPTRLRI